MSDSNKSLISGISKKWKLEYISIYFNKYLTFFIFSNKISRQIPTKKLEIENKLMEERLNQLKNELSQDKSKRRYE